MAVPKAFCAGARASECKTPQHQLFGQWSFAIGLNRGAPEPCDTLFSNHQGIKRSISHKDQIRKPKQLGSSIGFLRTIGSLRVGFGNGFYARTSAHRALAFKCWLCTSGTMLLAVIKAPRASRVGALRSLECGCCHELGVLFVGVLIIKGLLLGVYIRA